MFDLAAATAVAFVNVGDRARGVAFYRDTLGLSHERADEFGDYLRSGQTLVRLTALPGYTAAGHPVFGWKVANLAAAIAALRAKGVAFTIYDGFGQDADGIWTAPDGQTRLAWFADPDGNALTLTEG